MPAPDVDYYAVLSLDPGADAVTIRKALVGEQRLWGVRQNAPDLAARHAAEVRLQLLTEVRGVLLDPSRRALYDVQRVPVWPTGAESLVVPTAQAVPRGEGAHRFWPTAVGGLAIAVFVLVPLLRGERAPATPVTSSVVASAPPAAPLPALAPVPDSAPTDVPIAPDSAAWPTVTVPVSGFVPRRYLSTDPPPQPVAPTATTTALAAADELLITLSGTPQSASGVPVATQPFALTGGRYVASWSIAGQPPCGIVIALAEPATPTGPVPVVLVNHVLKLGEGRLAQGQTSIVLNGGRYRLDVTADACAWSLSFKAASPG